MPHLCSKGGGGVPGGRKPEHSRMPWSRETSAMKFPASWQFHEWKAVATVNRDQPIWDQKFPNETATSKAVSRVLAEVAAPKTDILWRCSCGKVKTTTIQSTWTLDQVRGEP